MQTGPHGTKAAARSPGNGDGSVFGEVIPAELEQAVTVKPSWRPLSKQLASLQDAAAVPLTHAPSVPDDPLFVAASNRTEFSLLRQMRLLLTDGQWRCQWANKEIGKDHRSYRLWREAVSPQERRAKMAQAAKDRMAKVLALLAAGPAAWEAARQEDPELSMGICQPKFQTPLLLASELSPDQLDSVLMDQPLTLNVADMSPQDQALVRQSTSVVPNDKSKVTRTSPTTGATVAVFDMSHLPTTGQVVFKAKPLLDDPGSLEMTMFVFTESTHEFGLGDDRMLYLKAPGFAEDEKRNITARHRQEAADALAVKTPGAKTVTIEAGTKPEPGEPQLAAYLRAFATQTGLTVLAHWPQGSKALMDSKGFPKRLPASIVKKPAGEALDLLCKTYGGEWVQDETTVRLRALPVQASAIRRVVASPSPTAAAPTAAAPANSGPGQ